MTSVPRTPAHSTPATVAQRLLADFPVGGADPDFALVVSAKPKICALPLVGKMLPQCR